MSYRALETISGVLTWTTILLLFLLSWLIPAYAAVFIILFDIYWLLKTIYLSFYLRATFRKMRINLKTDWLDKLNQLERGLASTKSVSEAEQAWCPSEARTSEAESQGASPVNSTLLSYGASDTLGRETPSFREVRPSDVYHLIILPMSNEPYEVVRGSFESLTKANYPKDKLIVVLGVEERAGQPAREIAQKIEAEFSAKFFKFLITTHPQNLPGEIPGKGSNETWAVKRVRGLIIDPLIQGAAAFRTETLGGAASSVADEVGIAAPRAQADARRWSERTAGSVRKAAAPNLSYENILVSTFDADTQVPRDYFSRLTYVFLTCPNPQRSSFQPIPLFTNNIFEAPALARVISFSTTFWQMMQQSRPERLTTFSSHSMPFKALTEIGFWNTNIVSEDSQIFWQCYLHYGGDWRVEPLFYPVAMDANVAPSFWRTMLNLYKQQRRWAWGSENIPYMLKGFRKNSSKGGPKIPLRKKLYWGFNVIEGFHSWATNALIIFALGWLPILLGGHQFNFTLLSYNLPLITRWLMTIAMFGIVTSAILSILLLPPKPVWFKPWHYLLYFIQWALMPLTLIVFGSIPAIEAQTRLMFGGRLRLGFWVTPKSRRGS